MAELVLSFIIGGVFGALVMIAWLVDGQIKPAEREPTEGGVWPL